MRRRGHGSLPRAARAGQREAKLVGEGVEERLGSSSKRHQKVSTLPQNPIRERAHFFGRRGPVWGVGWGSRFAASPRAAGRSPRAESGGGPEGAGWPLCGLPERSRFFLSARSAVNDLAAPNGPAPTGAGRGGNSSGGTVPTLEERGRIGPRGRHRCSPVPSPAASCKAGDASRRHF